MEVSILDTSKGLVRCVRPVKVAGRAILFVEQNMWIYVPGTRRALRISPQQRILGGVSNADVAPIKLNVIPEAIPVNFTTFVWVPLGMEEACKALMDKLMAKK